MQRVLGIVGFCLLQRKQMPKTSEDRMHLFGKFISRVVMRGFEGARASETQDGGGSRGGGPGIVGP